MIIMLGLKDLATVMHAIDSGTAGLHLGFLLIWRAGANATVAELRGGKDYGNSSSVLFINLLKLCGLGGGYAPPGKFSNSETTSGGQTFRVGEEACQWYPLPGFPSL